MSRKNRLDEESYSEFSVPLGRSQYTSKLLSNSSLYWSVVFSDVESGGAATVTFRGHCVFVGICRLSPLLPGRGVSLPGECRLPLTHPSSLVPLISEYTGFPFPLCP